MKYIIYSKNSGRDVDIIRPVIFDSLMQHSTMANVLELVRDEVLTAGFIELSGKGIRCYGKSISLKVESMGEEDAKLVQKFFDMD